MVGGGKRQREQRRRDRDVSQARLISEGRDKSEERCRAAEKENHDVETGAMMQGAAGILADVC